MRVKPLFELPLPLNVHPIIMETIGFSGGATRQWDQLRIHTMPGIEMRPYCYDFETIAQPSETTSELGETKPKRYSKHLERVMRAAATFR